VELAHFELVPDGDVAHLAQPTASAQISPPASQQ
jgi:hypothetical protein